MGAHALLPSAPMFRRTDDRAARQRGSAMIEMALVSGLFFMALLPIYDFGRTWYVQSNLQHATRSTARLLTLGTTVAGLTRGKAVGALLGESSGLNLSGAQVAVVSKTLAGSGAGTGATGELVTVTASLDVPLVTPYLQPFFQHGVYRVRASATFLNEVATGV